jgi:hypothetical protein
MNRAYVLLVGASLALLLAISTISPAQAQGPPGATTAFATFKELGDPGLPITVPAGGAFVTIGTLKLPPGSYVVTASLYLTNGSGSPGIGYCTVQIGDRNAQVIDTLPVGEAVSQALTVAAPLSAAGMAELKCTNNVLIGGNLSLETFNLNAIKVSALTFQ